MCGRYTQTADKQTLELRFKSDGGSVKIVPRYNIAPGQEAPLVVWDGKRKLMLKSWGLVLPWTKGKRSPAGMINARSETAAVKPAYRQPFERRRCLVISDGFYEWKKARGRSPRIPVRFARTDGAPFAFAGLWEAETFTILTTSANALVKRVHDRMPVILSREEEDAWLEPETELEVLQDLLQPNDPAGMNAVEVSTRVNSPKNDDPSLLEAVPDPQGELGL